MKLVFSVEELTSDGTQRIISQDYQMEVYTCRAGELTTPSSLSVLTAVEQAIFDVQQHLESQGIRGGEEADK